MTRTCTTIPQSSYRSASSRGTEENPNWTPKTWHSGTAGGEICGSFRVTDDHAHDVRICPGLLVAESTLFITVATMLSVFKFSPVEENGKFVMPPVQQTDGLIRYAPTPHLSWFLIVVRSVLAIPFLFNVASSPDQLTQSRWSVRQWR